MSQWTCRICNGTVIPMGLLGQREHGRCRACGADHHRASEDLSFLDEEPAGLTPEEMAEGLAQFEAIFPNAIVTRPGESLIETVQAAREEDERFNNDMKGRA